MMTYIKCGPVSRNSVSCGPGNSSLPNDIARKITVVINKMR